MEPEVADVSHVDENDHKIDPKAIEDFLRFTGYTPKEFWDIFNKFYNPDIFEKVDNVWILRSDAHNGL